LFCSANGVRAREPFSIGPLNSRGRWGVFRSGHGEEDAVQGGNVSSLGDMREGGFDGEERV